MPYSQLAVLRPPKACRRWLYSQLSSILALMRSAIVKFKGRTAGRLTEDEKGFHFRYDEAYLDSGRAEPVSRTLPLRRKGFASPVLFPFFDGLIPEGWLRRLVEQHYELDRQDRMGLLLASCRDAIGAVSIHTDNAVES